MPALTLQILQDNNTPESTFEFYPDEDRELRVQIIEEDTDQQWPVPELGRSLSFIVPGNPDNLTIANGSITVDSRNASIISTEIAGSTTEDMSSGNLRLIATYYDEGSAPDLSSFTTGQNAKLTIDSTDYNFAGDGNSDGTFTTNSTTDLEVGQIGTIVDDDSTSITVKVDSIEGGSPFTVGVVLATQKTRMAQLRNGVRRLNPNPIV